MTVDEVVRRLRAIERQQQRLDARLQAVENSLYFRTARAVGAKLTRWRDSLISSQWGALFQNVFPPPPDPYHAYALAQDHLVPVANPAGATISILLPLDPLHREHWNQAVASVLAQTFAKWELLVFGGEPDPAATRDPRIRLHRGQPWTLAQAAAQAQGEYLCALPSNGFIDPHALAWIAGALPASLVYTDEDRITAGRFVDPLFKPGWSPDLLRSVPYLGNLCVYHRDLWRNAEAGRPDVLAAARPDELIVRHIPKVLYHGRDEHGAIRTPSAPTWPANPDSLVSVIICSRSPHLLDTCLSALAENTLFARREVLVVQHLGHDDASLSSVIDRHQATAIPYSGRFHFSRMNNLAAARAGGDVLVFLNDDVRPLEPSWLQRIVGQLARPDVGVAGARLLYPSGRLQHAGVTVGIGDGCGHIGRDTFASPYWPWLTITREVSAVTGACLGIRRELFQQLSGFSERYPVNYNDVDLCLRVRKQNLRVIFESGAVLQHDECQTRVAGVSYQERLNWWMDWGDFMDAGDPFYSPHLTDQNESLSLRPIC
jgi:GT2 family glycosyltransferase